MQTWRPKQHIVRNIAAEGRRQLVHGRHHLAHGLAHGRQQVTTGIARGYRQLSEGSAHAAHWLSSRAHTPESWHVHFEHGQAQALHVASAVALVAGCATSQPASEEPAYATGGGTGVGGEDPVTVQAGSARGDTTEDEPEPERGWWWTDPTLSGGKTAQETQAHAADDGQPPPGGIDEAPRANEEVPEPGTAESGYSSGSSESGASAPLDSTQPATPVFGEPAGGGSFTGPWYSTGF